MNASTPTFLALALLALAGCSRHGASPDAAAGPGLPTIAANAPASGAAPEALPSTPLPPTAAGPAIAASAGPELAAASDPDAEFLRKAAASGRFSVAAASLATQRATRPDVKAFAQRLVQDHTVANAELTTLAQVHDVALPSRTDDAHRMAIEGLAARQGPDFDEAFLQNVGEHQHQVDLQMLAIESASAQSADVREWAARASETFNRDLVDAQRLAGQSPR